MSFPILPNYNLVKYDIGVSDSNLKEYYNRLFNKHRNNLSSVFYWFVNLTQLQQSQIGVYAIDRKYYSPCSQYRHTDIILVWCKTIILTKETRVSDQYTAFYRFQL